MEWGVIISAILGLLGSGIGSLGGIIISSKLVNFRLEALEKKFDDIEIIDKKQTELESKFDNIMALGEERRRKILDFESELNKLRNEVNTINTRIVVIESNLKILYKQGD